MVPEGVNPQCERIIISGLSLDEFSFEIDDDEVESLSTPLFELSSHDTEAEGQVEHEFEAEEYCELEFSEKDYALNAEIPSSSVSTHQNHPQSLLKNEDSEYFDQDSVLSDATLALLLPLSQSEAVSQDIKSQNEFDDEFPLSDSLLLQIPLPGNQTIVYLFLGQQLNL